jgi:RNA-splicing ligase RtcB
MPYNKLNISGAKADVLAWVNHDLSIDEQNMLRNVSRLPCLYKHVALMPDAHLGIGSMVGSVVATKDAVIPATVGVDIGCFTGDTVVPTLDGKSYSLRELAERGEEIVVYACTESGKIVAAKATAKKTRSKAELVKVTLDNGAEIRCTPDHQFMLRDGSFAQAKDLKTGASLMPFYRKTEENGSIEVEQNYMTAHNHKIFSVEPIAEREDVYCLTVPKYHNFALEAGIFVHNCGMAAIKTPFKSGILDGKLKELRHEIERAIPVGFHEYKESVDESSYWEGWAEFKQLHGGVQDRKAKAMKQLGTLGGGKLPRAAATR